MGAKIVLLTESTENMAKLEMCLSRFGHTILPAERITQASDMIRNDSTIDLVLADLKLTWGDSFELLKMVRADHLLSNLPFVLLCNSDELNDSVRRAAAILGTDKFLFMDQFEPHRVRMEIEALLPEQETMPVQDLIPPMDIRPEA